MKDVLTVFSDLSVPFTLEGGSLLHLARSCSLGGSDLDFVLQLGWLNDSNSQRLDSALKSKGLEKVGVHGMRENLGYEESWRRDGIKECCWLVMLQYNDESQYYRLTSSPARSHSTEIVVFWGCGLMEN